MKLFPVVVIRRAGQAAAAAGYAIISNILTGLRVSTVNTGTLTKPAVNPALAVSELPARLLVDSKPALSAALLSTTGTPGQVIATAALTAVSRVAGATITPAANLGLVTSLLDATGTPNRPANNPALTVVPRVDNATVTKPSVTPALTASMVVSGALASAAVNPGMASSLLGGTGTAKPTHTPALDIDLQGVTGLADKPAQNPAFQQSARISEFKAPETPAAEILQVVYSLVHRKGGTATDVGGADNWTDVGNASGEHNDTLAEAVGELLAARTREMQIAYADFVNKTDLTITSVQLHFYVEQAGTVLNNGDLQLRYNIGAGLVTLQTILNDVDALTTPITHDLTAIIAGSWATLNALLAQVEHRTALGENLITAAVDAVELEVQAARTDTL